MSVKKNILALRQNLYNPVLVDWNQLVLNNYFTEVTKESPIVQGYPISRLRLNVVANHKYYLSVQSKVSDNYPASVRANVYIYSYTEAKMLFWTYLKKRGEYEKITGIFTSSIDAQISFQQIRNETKPEFQEENPITISTKNPMIIDLTQMFGAGNEPTIEQCRKIFVADYYPYCASEPMLMGDGALVNFNQLVKDGNKEYKLIGNNKSYYIVYKINNTNKVTTINHRYYFAFNIELNTTTKKVNSGLHWNYSNYDFIVNITNKLGLVEQIVNCSKETPLNYIYIHQPSGVPLVEGEDIIITNYILIDLTQVFGEGNEPTTLEEFKKLYPNEYYEYVESRTEYVDKFIENGVIEG